MILPVTEPSHAVFLSYASQDAEAAQKICEALRAAGIEVWFDQSELRGGDAWDQSIRKQIKICALFLPVISHTTHDRREGYFRLEWKLAVDRCHLMDAEMAFLLPVVIDDTRDDDERVPERFREVQWTRLPGGVTPARLRRACAASACQASRHSADWLPAPLAYPRQQTPRQRFILGIEGRAAWRRRVVLVALAISSTSTRISKRGAEAWAAPASAGQAPPPRSPRRRTRSRYCRS